MQVLSQINDKKPIISLLVNKIPNKINVEKIGCILPDKSITFASPASAFEYAKNKCVKALQGEKPYEHCIIISENRILQEIKGERTTYPTLSEIKSIKNLKFMHGHPDMYDKGYTTPISMKDFATLKTYNFDELISFNSLGEYSKIAKLNNSNNLYKDEIPRIKQKWLMLRLKCGREALLGFKNIVATKRDCKKIHRFWVKNAEKLGISYETNYSNLIK